MIMLKIRRSTRFLFLFLVPGIKFRILCMPAGTARIAELNPQPKYTFLARQILWPGNHAFFSLSSSSPSAVHSPALLTCLHYNITFSGSFLFAAGRCSGPPKSSSGPHILTSYLPVLSSRVTSGSCWHAHRRFHAGGVASLSPLLFYLFILEVSDSTWRVKFHFLGIECLILTSLPYLK